MSQDGHIPWTLPENTSRRHKLTGCATFRICIAQALSKQVYREAAIGSSYSVRDTKRHLQLNFFLQLLGLVLLGMQSSVVVLHNVWLWLWQCCVLQRGGGDIGNGTLLMVDGVGGQVCAVA